MSPADPEGHFHRRRDAARLVRAARLRRSRAPPPPPGEPPPPDVELAVKAAPAEMLAFTVKVQVGCVPLHAPDQPEKALFVAATSVSVIEVPVGWARWTSRVRSVQPCERGYAVFYGSQPGGR